MPLPTFDIMRQRPRPAPQADSSGCQGFRRVWHRGVDSPFRQAFTRHARGSLNEKLWGCLWSSSRICRTEVSAPSHGFAGTEDLISNLADDLGFDDAS